MKVLCLYKCEKAGLWNGSTALLFSFTDEILTNRSRAEEIVLREGIFV